MADLDRVAAGVDVDVAAGAENQRHTPRTNGSAGSAALETGGVARIADTASVTKDTADAPQTSIQEKIAVPEKTITGTGNDEPVPAGKRVLEKEPGRHQKKLNGPEKHCEAHRGQAKLDQHGVQNASRPRARRWWRCRRISEPGKKPLSVAYEENKILQADLLREGESIEKKQEPHHVSREHGGNSESRTTRN